MGGNTLTKFWIRIEDSPQQASFPSSPPSSPSSPLLASSQLLHRQTAWKQTFTKIWEWNWVNKDMGKEQHRTWRHQNSHLTRHMVYIFQQTQKTTQRPFLSERRKSHLCSLVLFLLLFLRGFTIFLTGRPRLHPKQNKPPETKSKQKSMQLNYCKCQLNTDSMTIRWKHMGMSRHHSNHVHNHGDIHGILS